MSTDGSKCPVSDEVKARFAGCPVGGGVSSIPENEVYYSTYLGLPRLLTSQDPLSRDKDGKAAHEEMLFIITHQTYELWFKQILHELKTVVQMLNQDYVEESCLSVINNRLHRVTEIQRVLIDQIRILETMNPHDFLDFRDVLTPASGFQSVQFRELEARLGLSNEERVMYQSKELFSYFSEEDAAYLAAVAAEPSLLSALQRWLERTPFLQFEEYDFWSEYKGAVKDMLRDERGLIENNAHLSADSRESLLKQHERTAEAFEVIFDEEKYNAMRAKGMRRLSYRAMQAALLIFLYRDQPMFQAPCNLLTLLMDIDEFLTTWRYRHTMMVQRMIGVKLGSGGSAGYYYLKSTVSDRYKVFVDIFNLSTYLIPRKKLPTLPPSVGRQMAFYYQNSSSINPAGVTADGQTSAAALFHTREQPESGSSQ